MTKPYEQAVASAMAEGRARGLPDGWTVKFDARNRRKWVSPSPNQRVYDSLPKALARVEKDRLQATAGRDGASMTTSKKRPAPSHHSLGSSSNKKQCTSSGSSLKLAQPRYPPTPKIDEQEAVEPESESDPETSLDLRPERRTGADDAKSSSRAVTVHWNPTSPEGKRVGYRIRVFDQDEEEWRDGRVLRYDPRSNKHNIQYDDDGECCWLRLKHEIIQCGSRFVWALVKGFAWWPAQVLDCEPATETTNKDGYVFVKFFGADQVAMVRDTPDFIRPFNNGNVDEVIAKNKKKRNVKAIEVARTEQATTQQTRNKASLFYAKKAFAFANSKASGFLGRRVEFFRSDINYPSGDTVTGTVRQYSSITKKWLVSYDPSKHTLGPSWVSLLAKECNYKFLDKEKGKKQEPSEIDLAPFKFGFRDGDGVDSDAPLSQQTHCSGCMEEVAGGAIHLKCGTCRSAYHIGCTDPPMSAKAVQRIMDEGGHWLCPKCTTCVGCNKFDIAFGSRSYPSPPTLHNRGSTSLELCSACVALYENDRFCPDCGHVWDDVRYQKTQRVLRWQNRQKTRSKSRTKKKRKKKTGNDDSDDEDPSKGSPSPDDTDDDNNESNPSKAVDPSRYDADSSVWGFNEGAMLICDSCNLWVHAGCAGLTRDQYEETNRGEHPIYSKEFLCRTCCVRRCQFLISALQKEDAMMLFATPVTEQMAPNYHDVIKNPMDLQSMMNHAQKGKYHNYAWVRELFELMVFNALTFNRPTSKYWNEAKRYHETCMSKVFKKQGKAAPPGKFAGSLNEAFEKAKRWQEMEKERVQKDETAEKKDLVAGAEVTKVNLAPLSSPIDLPSCVPFADVRLKPVDAFYCAWMDCCFSCGSSGASDTMLFCVDCGEAYHSFCANAPIHSMTASAVDSWRCPNCKVCEITGDVPEDETMLLYCEMCDRAYTLTELDPPLKSAPSGLFICGLCVDCKVCGNRGEKGKRNVRYWSRDPQKCYRCGGCKGLVDKKVKGMKCTVCSKIWRKTDNDLVPCMTCKRSVHAACDKRASDILKQLNDKATNIEAAYECPQCRRKIDEKIEAGALSIFLRNQARQVLLQGCHAIVPNEQMGLDELHWKLAEAAEWQIREMWRNEYQNLVADAERMLGLATKKFGGGLNVLFTASEKDADIPNWMLKRAARWVRYKRNFTKPKSGKEDIRAAVLRAKMAAAFIYVACRSMGLGLRKNVKCPDRVKVLLIPPDKETGATIIPADPMRIDSYQSIMRGNEISMKEFNSILQGSASLSEDRSVQSSNDAMDIDQASASPDGDVVATMSNITHQSLARPLPVPLSGWDDAAHSIEHRRPWRDPRSCCFCHTCGDDDAGIPESESHSKEQVGVESAPSIGTQPSKDIPIVLAGRLLPMPGGLWAHSGCSLWSSEVWESPEDGLIHALDKARYRGSKLKCFGCGRPGATIGCQKANCSLNYHLLCAKACGAVFTTKQQILCKNHKEGAKDLLADDCISFEQMKPMKVAAERENNDESGDINLCYRVGSIVVHSLGSIEQEVDGFHSEHYITPPGYTATRIFWSFRARRRRTLYVLKVDRDGNRPSFSITASDAPEAPIRGRSMFDVYSTMMDRVRRRNKDLFSQGDFFSQLPMKRVRGKKAYGLNAPQFFGFGLHHIRKAFEACSGVAAVVVPVSPNSPAYRFCFSHPDKEDIKDLQRKRAAAAAEKALENPSGSARTEGMHAVDKSGGSGRITRALVRRADEDQPANAEAGSARGRGSQNLGDSKSDFDSNQEKYREMKAVPMGQRLVAKRSHIHGWGLFTKLDLPKHSMIVEYMGEILRHRVADKREKAYETSGVGSCYMFRLDLHRIADATMVGCMARFMNHSCQNNAYAKIITVNTDQGQEKKIVVFANRDISAGEEITYDYKFPVEDGSLKCTCGAPNCIGRMN